MLRTLALVILPVLTACSTAQPSLPQLRMTPDELNADSASSNQIGSSRIAGVHTKVLVGDPSQSGFYTLLLFVPRETTIQAHAHRDDRIATVLTGEWHFGYGEHFSSAALKTLPAGSVYSEPGGAQHFAQTTADDVVVQISGYGPTDTVYFERANEPSKHD